MNEPIHVTGCEAENKKIGERRRKSIKVYPITLQRYVTSRHSDMVWLQTCSTGGNRCIAKQGSGYIVLPLFRRVHRHDQAHFGSSVLPLPFVSLRRLTSSPPPSTSSVALSTNQYTTDPALMTRRAKSGYLLTRIPMFMSPFSAWAKDVSLRAIGAIDYSAVVSRCRICRVDSR